MTYPKQLDSPRCTHTEERDGVTLVCQLHRRHKGDHLLEVKP